MIDANYSVQQRENLVQNVYSGISKRPVPEISIDVLRFDYFLRGRLQGPIERR